MFNHDKGFLLLSEHSYTFIYFMKGVFSPTVKLCNSILSEIVKKEKKICIWIRYKLKDSATEDHLAVAWWPLAPELVTGPPDLRSRWDGPHIFQYFLYIKLYILAIAKLPGPPNF